LPGPAYHAGVATIRSAVDHAVVVLGRLRDVGEEIADEWQYVTDLGTVWSARLGEVAEARGDELLEPPIVAALEELSGQATAVTDSHRAIDWLSTYPQAVLAVLGEPA
jgi:predicted oxidoreductase